METLESIDGDDEIDFFVKKYATLAFMVKTNRGMRRVPSVSFTEFRLNKFVRFFRRTKGVPLIRVIVVTQDFMMFHKSLGRLGGSINDQG